MEIVISIKEFFFQFGSSVLGLSVSGKNSKKNTFSELVVGAKNRTTCDFLFAYFYMLGLVKL